MSKGNLLIILLVLFWLIFLGGCQEQSDAEESAFPTKALPAPGITALAESPRVEEPPMPSETADPAEFKRDFLWREDIDAFSAAYKRKHVDLFYWRDEDFFDRQVNELRDRVHELSDLQIALELGKIINSMQDMHSVVNIEVTDHCDKFFPLQFSFLEDGLYIINVYLGDFPDYQDVLYNKVVAVNGMDEAEVRERVFPFLCGERYDVGRQALYAEMFAPYLLYGAGVAGWDEGFVFTLEREDGVVYDKKIETISYAVRDNAQPAVSYPMLFTTDRSENWYTYSAEDQTLYLAYNVCMDDDDILRPMFEEMREILTGEDVKNIVVDLRNNGYGNGKLLEPFISMLTVLRAQYEKLYVVISNSTFAPAVRNAAQLAELDGAVLIGEPAGSPVYDLGGTMYFSLPYSELRCVYTTVINTPDLGRTHLDFEDSSLEPDVYVPNTIDNYRNQTDAVWEYITSAP